MKKLLQKLSVAVVILCMVMTAFGSFAFATEGSVETETPGQTQTPGGTEETPTEPEIPEEPISYEQVASDAVFTLKDTFTRDEYTSITVYPAGASSQDGNISVDDELGLGKAIDGTWSSKVGYTYTENATEYAPTMTGVNNGAGAVTFGISETDKLFINAPRNYASGGTRILPKTLPATPGINYNMQASDLKDNFVINVTTQVANNVNMWGIKFMQHNDEKNYYLFYTGGTNTLNGGGKVVKWAIYKIRDGAIVGAKEFTNSDTQLASVGIGANHRLTLSFIDGTISFKLGYGAGVDEYFSGSWTDSAPYTKANVVASQVDGKIAPIQLIAAQGGGTANATYKVKFLEFVMKEAVPYLVAGEPETVMYVDVANGAEDGVIDLGKEYTIRKLKYSGELAEGVVLVSNDNITYKKLTDISKFTEGEWLNNITAGKYRYIKSDAASDLEILTEFSEVSKLYNSKPFNVYAKIDGESVQVTGGDKKIATIDGSTVTTTGAGSTTFSATNGATTLTGTLKVENENSVYTSDELLSLADTANLIGAGMTVTGTDWRTKTLLEGHMGYEDNAPVKIASNKLRVFGSSNCDSYTLNLRYNQSENHNYYPALVYEGIDLGANQIIDLTFKKSDAYSYPAVKILAHNNGDGYILAFSGNNDGGNTWYLYKEVNDTVSLLALGDAIKDAPEGTFPLKNGESKLRICYSNGSIGFTLNYNDQYTLKGSYYDAAPFELDGVSTDLWLMAGCKYGNITTDNLLRYVDFYDISVKKYIENGFEFNRALYENKADGKAITDGVIDLEEANTIYYVKASNVVGNVDVYASSDGERYYYLTSFAADGYYQNTETDSKFRYIKLDGAAADVKVFAKVNKISKNLVAEVEATDNTNITITCDDLSFTKGQTLLIAQYDENDALSSVKMYKESVNFSPEGVAQITVDDYSEGNKVKAFIWDSVNTISPIMGATNLK